MTNPFEIPLEDEQLPPSAVRRKHAICEPYPLAGPLKSILEKALDEVLRGNPQEGERLIELALMKDAETGVLISRLLATLRLHHAPHVAFEPGDDAESQKQLASAVEATRAALANVEAATFPQTSIQTITVHIEGGMVQEVTGIPDGYELRVEDYDAQDPGDDSWDADKECVFTIFDGGINE